MKTNTEKSPASEMGRAMAKFRWSKTSKKDRLAHSKKMIQAKKDKRALQEQA